MRVGKLARPAKTFVHSSTDKQSEISGRVRGIREIRGRSPSDNLAAAMQAIWGALDTASIRRLRTPTPPPRPEAEVWPFLSPPSRKRIRPFVRRLPEGDLRIAHAFKRGTMELGHRVPKGRLNHSDKNGSMNRCMTFVEFSRPCFGTCGVANLNPAVNCRAILKSPFGRENFTALPAFASLEEEETGGSLKKMRSALWEIPEEP